MLGQKIPDHFAAAGLDGQHLNAPDQELDFPVAEGGIAQGKSRVLLHYGYQHLFGNKNQRCVRAAAENRLHLRQGKEIANAEAIPRFQSVKLYVPPVQGYRIDIHDPLNHQTHGSNACGTVADDLTSPITVHQHQPRIDATTLQKW
ncbi:hypothetical protein DSY1487 [Desulfitobacterium hafniense Y51]|uniref:Uncharacterized protein n=1 Tax=Desulfitobacterium hafniense (strain Y51) TaxID=138119 RepID=Q24XG6_DESHY|nr:hypothetical protein DSY1487 [Desulfitobacterium hafniense Y51]